MRTKLHLLVLLALASAFGADAADTDIKTLNTPRTFPEISSQADWQERSRAIRQQILVSAGLWPLPQKPPLKAVISGKIERDGYSVEKVYFQSWPGFYVAGNLYRPLGKGTGPFPGILNPHGHWEHGRLEDSVDCSSAGRCINFARQGMVALAYDMVGYNDTTFPDFPKNESFYNQHHSFASNDPIAMLWSVTLMGLQTWDSIRALDFLESLPDVDKTRLACTGESGGGTQTMIMGAIDDRLAAQSPVVMVSHTMQGGCLCENMPGLRVEYSNMEIAAAAAPRPQILVSDTKDWTKTTLTVEGPAIEHIYQLFQAPEKLRYVCFDAVHNYNQTSREAVYQWFDKWLLQAADQPVKEQSFQKEPDADLRVFPDGKLPSDAVSQKDLIAYLIQMHRNQLQKISPTNETSLANYKQIMQPAWERTLQFKWPMLAGVSVRKGPDQAVDFAGEDIEVVSIQVRGDLPEFGETVKIVHFISTKPLIGGKTNMIVLAHPDGKAPYVDNAGKPIGLARLFLDQGFDIILPADAGRAANQDQTSLLFTTYNRTRLQQRVRDLVLICEGIRNLSRSNRVVLCGSGHAGLWALLAAPAADAVIADCCQLDVSDDESLLDPDLFCPGICNIDRFEGAALMASPHPLYLHNVGKGWRTDRLRATYPNSNSDMKFKVSNAPLTDAQIVAAALAME